MLALLRLALAAFLLSSASTLSADAQSTSGVVLRASNVVAAVGATSVRVDVTIDSSNGSLVDGWQFGLCHDAALLSLGGSGAALPSGNEVLSLQEFGGTTPNGNSIAAMPVVVADFATDAVFDDGPGGMDDGFTSAVVVDSLGSETLPVSSANLVNVAFYDVVGSMGASGSLQFCSSLGTVSAEIVISQVTSTPIVEDGDVLIGAPPSTFLRGDCNQTGDVDLSDAIGFLAFFNGVASTNACVDTCDFDGNGVLELLDAIQALQFLFLSGSPPASPFPTCGSASLQVDIACSYPTSLCP